MTVTEHLGSDQSDNRGAIDPLAAAELAQELNLVAKSLFAQLLPSTATRALSGVPGLGTPALDTQFAAPSIAASAPEPDQLQVPVTVLDDVAPLEATPGPVTAPVAEPLVAVAVPVPSLPVTEEPAPMIEAPAAASNAPASIPVPTLAPVPVAPPAQATHHKPEQHSLAMLEEIGFLDE